MHIRYNTTGKYYEYSLSGTDTGPWTKLDLTGHTGTLPANIAYVDVDNAWAYPQTKIPSHSRIKGANSVLWFEATQASPEPKQWRVLTYDQGHLYWERFNAAGAYIGGGPTFMGDGGLSVPAPIVGTTLTVSGGVVAFPVVQVPSVSANHLDDYEEGTWTPYYTASSGSGTYTIQSGNYIKIGRHVLLNGRILMASKGSLSGVLTILGLPFTPISEYGSFSISHWGGLASSMAWLGGLTYPSSASADIRCTFGGQTTITNLAAAHIAASGFDIIFTASYLAAN